MKLQNKNSNFFYSKEKVLFILGLAVIILLSVPVFNNFNKRRAIDREVDEIEEEIKMVENKNSELKNLLSYLESDEFVEEQARLNFDLKKNGENVVIVKSEGETASSGYSGNGKGGQAFLIPGYRDDVIIPESGNPQKWFNYFFK